ESLVMPGPGDDPGRLTLSSGTTPPGYRRIIMAWWVLFLAGLLEIGWAIGLKYTYGFTKLWPSLWTLAAMGLSFAFLSYALKTLPVGTAYAVWTGIGVVGTAILGILLFGEALSILRLVCILLIVTGIAGLRWLT